MTVLRSVRRADRLTGELPFIMAWYLFCITALSISADSYDDSSPYVIFLDEYFPPSTGLYWETPIYDEICIAPLIGVICERVFMFILDAFTHYSTMTSFIYSLQSLWLEIVDCPASHGFPGPYHIMFDIKPVYSGRRLCLNEFRAAILKHSIALRRIENLFSETGIHGIGPYIKTLGLSHKIIIGKCLSA